MYEQKKHSDVEVESIDDGNENDLTLKQCMSNSPERPDISKLKLLKSPRLNDNVHHKSEIQSKPFSGL